MTLLREYLHGHCDARAALHMEYARRLELSHAQKLEALAAEVERLGARIEAIYDRTAESLQRLDQALAPKKRK